MFGSAEKSLCATLSQMHKTALDTANANQIEAAALMQSYLKADRRFDAFDPARLVERVSEVRSCGRVMDLHDPYLRRNGQHRPNEW